jgi:hypothetical protein
MTIEMERKMQLTPLRRMLLASIARTELLKSILATAERVATTGSHQPIPSAVARRGEDFMRMLEK